MRQKAHLKSGPIQYWILNVDLEVCKISTNRGAFTKWVKSVVHASAFVNTSETIIALAVQ
jgi:hypothetical protein